MMIEFSGAPTAMVILAGFRRCAAISRNRRRRSVPRIQRWQPGKRYRRSIVP